LSLKVVHRLELQLRRAFEAYQLPIVEFYEFDFPSHAIDQHVPLDSKQEDIFVKNFIKKVLRITRRCDRQNQQQGNEYPRYRSFSIHFSKDLILY